MADFDYKQIVRESVEEGQIKDEHLKHIEAISKHLSEPNQFLKLKGYMKVKLLF